MKNHKDKVLKLLDTYYAKMDACLWDVDTEQDYVDNLICLYELTSELKSSLYKLKSLYMASIKGKYEVIEY